jgi:hypothetical protein
MYFDVSLFLVISSETFHKYLRVVYQAGVITNLIARLVLYSQMPLITMRLNFYPVD